MSTILIPELSAYWDEPDSFRLAAYKRTGGYEALPKALALQPDQVIQALKDSALRGRGGAGFPTGNKWGFIPQGDGKPHYLVVNADESEPGACKDIPTLLANPQALIEGIIITCYAIRAEKAFIYVRGEVLHVTRRLQLAVAEAYEAGYLGERILGSDLTVDVVVHCGAGAYICGEETALLDSLEGFRGQPRLKPPFPAVAGLYACPTVVNNVESIATVPYILRYGAAEFTRFGTERSKGFGLFSLSGHVTTPGQYEAPLGTTLRELLGLAGGDARRQSAEVLDARRLVDAAVYRPAPGRAARLRVRRRGRVDARYPVGAAVRRDDLRGAGRAPLGRVLPARVVRQVHPVPRGQLVGGPAAAGPGARRVEHSERSRG